MIPRRFSHLPKFSSLSSSIIRPVVCRHYLSSKTIGSASPGSGTASLGPKWLSDIKARIGKCIMFGLKPAQVDEAGEILQKIGTDWRQLLAGLEGYLTCERRRGLSRQSVVWGEMVCSQLRFLSEPFQVLLLECTRDRAVG